MLPPRLHSHMSLQEPPPPSLASQLPTTSKTAVKRLAGREARSTIFSASLLRSLQIPLPITRIYTGKNI
ncbi:hypothetical protein ACFX16_002677 [Malus domestica]